MGKKALLRYLEHIEAKVNADLALRELPKEAPQARCHLDRVPAGTATCVEAA